MVQWGEGDGKHFYVHSATYLYFDGNIVGEGAKIFEVLRGALAKKICLQRPGWMVSHIDPGPPADKQ